MLNALRRRYLDVLASIYIYNGRRGHMSIDRVLEAVRVRCPDDALFIAAIEKHRTDERDHHVMFRRWFELRREMPLQVDRACGHIDRLVIVERDEPSHWQAYRERLTRTGRPLAKWHERPTDFWIHRELLFIKLPLLFMNYALPRRREWADADEVAPTRAMVAASRDHERQPIEAEAPGRMAVSGGSRMRHGLSCALFLTLAVPVAARAQQGPALSLDALAADVVSTNPERRFYQRQIETAGVERDAAGRRQDPTLTVEFGERRITDPVTNVRTGDAPAYAASVLQPIEFGGRIALRRAIAEAQIGLARNGLAQFDATLVARARSLGYALFAADEKAAAAREVAARMRTLARVIVSRDPAGPAPTLDAAALQAQAITAEREAASADAQANSALYELNQLRAAPFAARIRITRPDMTLPALPAAATLAARVDGANFELRALRAQFEQQGLRVDLARKTRIPVVSVGPYYDNSRADRQTNYGLRLSTTLPVWNAQAGQVAQEQGRQAQADATLIAAQRRIAREVYDQAAQYEAKRTVLAQWTGDTPERFAAAAREADRSFRLGAIPLTTYTQIQSSYLGALNAVLDTRREAMEALLGLRALAGGSLGGRGAE